MLLIIGFALVILWLIVFVVFPVLGWFVHILLVIAVVVILVRIIGGGRRP